MEKNPIIYPIKLLKVNNRTDKVLYILVCRKFYINKILTIN